MTGNKRKGTVKIVAKTGGLMLQGDETWLNPTASCKNFVKPDLKGCEVELDISEDGKNFSFIKVLTHADTKPAYTPKTFSGGYNTAVKKEVDWDLKDAKMVRMNVLNRAVDMFIHDKIEQENILDFATKFENWVNGGEVGLVVKEEEIKDY
jgi:hypothetical protein